MKQISKQQLKIKNATSECDALMTFLSESLSKLDLSEETYNDLRLVSEETFSNIVNYAYQDNEQTIIIEIIASSHSIDLTFIDNGIAFNPLIDSNKDIDTIDKCEGGMGIHLITTLTDKQVYKRLQKRNVFTLTKNYTE